MSRALTAGEFKALFRQLVKAVGGVEAAGVTLEISHQRVTQLQSPNTLDLPSFLQVNALEVVAERAIVTGAAARAIEGEPDREIDTLAVEAVGATAKALRLVHDAAADGVYDAAEARTIQSATREAADASTRLADKAARLGPGSAA